MTPIRQVELRPAHPGDLADVVQLLAEQNLPIAGVNEALLANAWLACSGPRIVGSAALEIYPAAGLLRSVAVRPAWRGAGIGSKLVRVVVAFSGRLGMRRLYLLTDTTPDFFSRLGFRILSRQEVNPAVRTSVEFTEACPETAVAMVLELVSEV